MALNPSDALHFFFPFFYCFLRDREAEHGVASCEAAERESVEQPLTPLHVLSVRANE